jgi:hypothetical protein
MVVYASNCRLSTFGDMKKMTDINSVIDYNRSIGFGPCQPILRMFFGFSQIHTAVIWRGLNR